MADILYRDPSIVIRRPRTDWGAIWAGVFVFVGIWSVFGLLGTAIFDNVANARAQGAGMGMSTGMEIWAVVLTIIAMYVAGRETGRLAAVTDRHDGLVHGMIMFGVSVVASLVITVIAGSGLTGGVGLTASTHNPYLVDLFAGLGWFAFLALFLGWLAALGGASSGAGSIRPDLESARPIQAGEAARQIDPAA